MKHKHNGGFVVSPERMAIVENEIEELFEMVEILEKQMKEKEKKIEKLKAELQNTSINDVSLADYIKENYVPIEVLDKIRAEIEQKADEEQKHDKIWAMGLRYAIKIFDKYRAEGEPQERSE